MFGQLQNLALCWAAVRLIGERCERLGMNVERWSRRLDRLVRTFVSGTLPTAPIGLPRVNRWALRVLDRVHKRRFPERFSDEGRRPPVRAGRPRLDRKLPGVHTGVITAAFGWLDLPESLREAFLVTTAAHDLLELSVGALSLVDDASYEGAAHPEYEFDGWILGQVAKAIAISDDAVARRSLWQPVLDLAPSGSGWIQQFFWSWFTEGAAAAESPDAFTQRWIEMVEYALEHPQWSPERSRGHQIDEMVGEMLGFHFGLQSVAKDATYLEPLGDAVLVFQRSAARWFGEKRLLRGFAAFVVQAGAGKLLRPGIRWLYDACRRLGPDDAEWERLDSRLVDVLSACWDRHAAEVSAEADLRTAFLGLLNTVLRRSNHAGLALRDRVLCSLPGV